MKMIKKIKVTINEKRLNIVSYIRKVWLHFTIDKKNIQHLNAHYKCKKEWYGNSYGGFYVNPDLINEKSIVYSFGIGKDISFDKRIMKKHGCHIYAFDPTPKSIGYIKGLKSNPLFHFYDYGISTSTKKELFFLPANQKGVSGSMTRNKYVDQENFIEVKMKTLNDIASEFRHKYIDVVKMDIEGSEYDVLETLLNSDIIITQLLVEFHDRFFEGEVRSKKTTEILRKKGFEVFAASLNYEEISFINTKIINNS